MKFTELGLVPEILRSIADQGYENPTPIQAQAIPVVLAGRDLMACAQTGTGKTAGFTLPILNRLAAARVTGPRKIRVLILTPTRELAAQVEDSVRTYGAHLPFKSLVIFGGVGINPQISALKNGVDILVATPGRLLDHAQQRNVDLSGVEVLVLDEADRMLDMGFIHDIRRVIKLVPKKRQNLLFSATFSDEIRTLAGSFLIDPEYVESERRNTAPELVKQFVYRVDRERKRDLLVDLIRDNGWYQVLVFTRTKWGANGLADKLLKAGIEADAIHGNKSQNARTRALANFKNGKLHVLVATDIAARGIDINELPHVVNYELPNVAEDYVHRIGRTGRAGIEGAAVSLVCVDELKLLHDIERLLKKQIEVVPYPDYAPDPSIRAEPILMRSAGSRGGQRSPAARTGGGARPGAANTTRAGSGKPPAGGGSHRSGSRHR
ncbi:MAG: DEAD/DEAH box helicase [Propionivibrio sp.]|uniref:DEAD/DEAH box helicase n=1 Tax=Propionivibrio sp. TaxID=2212460 RepID=UPI001A62DE12|nr:DEAD/DEAH box helicase [Propionivibrio sp.]MBL8413122.1 DEAD/DEAH box helicase [Propionivibrio sp.]